MNWKNILMMGLMQAPAVIGAVDAIKGSNTDKRTKALQGVMLGMQTFANVDPEDFTRVFSHPQVQDAIAKANDQIHFALKVVDTVHAGLPAPAQNSSPSIPLIDVQTLFTPSAPPALPANPAPSAPSVGGGSVSGGGTGTPSNDPNAGAVDTGTPSE